MEKITLMQSVIVEPDTVLFVIKYKEYITPLPKTNATVILRIHEKQKYSKINDKTILGRIKSKDIT
ncbi:MAG: hypothetical protein IKG79_06830, partial [Neisseriaceae bacterium]|nr:hypothetical protein [Neisseriaceae bacterium]